MKMKTTASTSGTDSATTIPVRTPSEAKLTHEHDNQRLDERAREFADRFLDHFGLIGDLFDIDADRRLGAHLVDRERRDSCRR